MDIEKIKKQISDAFERAEKERKRKAFDRWMRGENDQEVKELVEEVMMKAKADQDKIIEQAKEKQNGKNK